MVEGKRKEALGACLAAAGIRALVSHVTGPGAVGQVGFEGNLY